MSESSTQNLSTDLYHYLCKNIIGTEKHVKTIRMMNNVRDNLQSYNAWPVITSGSFGEGLEMRGSDLDIMRVIQCFEVTEDTHIFFNDDKSYFTMEMEDTQHGFTQLRLVHSNDQSILTLCDEIGSDFYFSNLRFKQYILNDVLSTMHGPCLSDENGVFDIAYCLHNKSWITQATKWLTRSNNSWPSSDVKQAIVKHGVLIVPVGVKGSTKEELEWRISFSVAEKILIYTFQHTQLLCYALLKIILKDIIDVDIDCKELLCSYFLKTVLFWISEELPPSIWKPENLISCFMRCFRRLIYCVEYKVCPHYFIPENNLFENKIQGHAQEKLLNKLYILNSYGWKCIELSDQICNVHSLSFDISKDSSYLHANMVEKILNSVMIVAENLNNSSFDLPLEKVLYYVLSSKSSKIRYLYTYYISKGCCKLLPFEEMSGNTSSYKQYNTFISTLLLNTHHDAVSGWLLLASFFYRAKQYNTVLDIIQYSLSKCTPEKLQRCMKFSDFDYELLNSHLLRQMTIVQLRRLFVLDLVVFEENSKLVPAELQLEVCWLIPPVVYAHFLGFLYNFHLKNSRQYWDSLKNLQLTIEEHYFIANRLFEALSYNILGISYQLLGKIESARHAFEQSIELLRNKKK